MVSKNKQQIQKLSQQELLKKLRIKARYAHYKKFYKQDSSMIDQGILLYFPQKCSYNREQMYQLHLHGSKAIVASVFDELKKLGMRMASRGQFTKRAVTNGRISLYEAQAINDLIRSQSEFSRQVAVNHLLGKNNQFLEQLRQQLIGSLAKTEAYIDFSDTQADVKESLFEQTKRSTLKTIKKVQSILKNYKNLQIVKDGVKVSIFGKPNAGKSTLMNCLVQRQVSIVNEQPGTTRDIIEASIQIAGVKVVLLDTAGLRGDASSVIENEGIRRAKEAITNSHFQILLIDWQQQQFVMTKTSLKIINPFQMAGLDKQNVIFIVNKADLLPSSINTVVIEFFQKQRQALLLSAQMNQGVQQLQSAIQLKIKKDYKIYQNSEEIYFTRQRYFDQLKNCLEQLNQYIQQDQPDLSSQHLRQAIKQIEQIFGRVDCEDVLDVLFRDFCIGK